MRLGKTMDVKLQVTGPTIGKRIAPLILMTFIENVFKYGTSNHEASVITIKIDVNEQRIYFFCQNRLFENKKVTDRTGIGIANTRQRLDHLYAGKYILDINADNGLYTVELRLDA
jgi:two-component system LytT family sensor kinase